MSVGEITHQQKSVMTGNMRKCQTAGSFPARFCVGVVKLGYTSLKHGYMSRGSDHGCGLHLIRAAKALCWFDSSRQQTRCGFAVGASESPDKHPGVSPGPTRMKIDLTGPAYGQNFRCYPGKVIQSSVVLVWLQAEHEVVRRHQPLRRPAWQLERHSPNLVG